MKAVMVHELGGPEVLRLEDRPASEPGPGQASVEVKAVGVNFVEIYYRAGMYKQSLPFGLGNEGAGVVKAVGPGVTEVQPGDRVAWLDGSTGSYASETLVRGDRLVPIPGGLDFSQAASVMVQGTTAYVFTHRTYPLKPGDRCLIHAAAGGAGLLLVQIAKMAGAYVIGTTSTAEKAERALAAGADDVILYTQQDFEAEVKRITGGKGVNVVYDSVGKDTFDKSLTCVAPLGYLVLFGQSSGFPPLFDIQRLAGMRSLFLTRPSVFAYLPDRASLLDSAGVVLNWVLKNKLQVRIDRSLPLDQAAEAHRALGARETSGKVLLIP